MTVLVGNVTRLQDKTIVVTGASGLLGVQHVLAVLSQEGNAVLLDLHADKMEKFISELPSELQKRVIPIECDITSESEVKHALEISTLKFGKISGLVNNAAINPSVEKNQQRFERLENLKFETWQEEINVGLWGAINCSRVFAGHMIQQKIEGSIVNISSDHGLVSPNQNLYRINGLADDNQPVKPVTYSVIKHGIIGLTRYLATYWAGNGLRVNTLCPGGVLNKQNEEFIKRVNALIPIGRLAYPNEYQGALIYLLSDESSYMTGSTMVVDGGRTVW